MRAIWLDQPFAYLVAVGGKDIECAAQPTSYRGPLLILASEREPSPAEVRHAEAVCRRLRCALPATYDLGGIVGIAQLVDCVTTSRSPWFEPGRYGFVLAHARPVPFIPFPHGQPLSTLASVEGLPVEGFADSRAVSPVSRTSSASKASPVRKPSREWFEKFQQRVDRAFAARQI